MTVDSINKVMIMGAGAVGGFTGVQIFQKKSAEVHFIARGEHFRNMKENGLRYITPEENINLEVPVWEDPADTGEVYDLIIVTVKSADTPKALEQIRPVIGEKTQVLTIQNGLDNYEYLVSQLGVDNVIRGFCRLGCEVTAPGEITYRSLGDVTIGEEDGSESKRCQAITELLGQSGITCTVADDILRQAWKKMIWNTVYNCLSGLTATTLDAIYADEQVLKVAQDIAQELRKIANAEGVTISDDEITHIFDRTDKLGAFKTSTYQDRLKGKPMEYDALSGSALRRAEETGVNAPKLETINAMLRLTEKSERY